MSKKEARLRACEEKEAFLSRDEANRVIHVIRKQGGAKLQSYNCQFCQCWHLTKGENNESKFRPNELSIRIWAV
jgi:hypothetical protein